MASIQQHDEWLNPTRDLLLQWGEHLRSINGEGLGYSSKASHLVEHGVQQIIPEDELADKVDRVLCKVKMMNSDVFAVLKLYYYLEHSERSISETLQQSRAKCRDMRLTGEVMVATIINQDETIQS
ncbi:MAG: hypothetical protein KZQ93_15920 [Candidatus Thiodiazotropha sp. (ex Monitilora ramsayi)]|nr:hypothetical protein [Candidatus Thiodiazotropha sp. (ex Monitilora ramsayi)]